MIVYHVEFSGRKTLEWLHRNIYLVLAFLWVLLVIVGLFFWESPGMLLFLMGLYMIVAGAFVVVEASTRIATIQGLLRRIEVREGSIESDLQMLLASIKEYQEEIMAIGNETKAALTELREAIATETDQAVEKIIAATNADAATAEAIREAVADVKNIIPDDVEETDVPTVQEPEDPETPGDDEVEVDPEALPGDDA